MDKTISEHIDAIQDLIGTFYADGRRGFFCVACENGKKSIIVNGTTELTLSSVCDTLGEIIADVAEDEVGFGEVLFSVLETIQARAVSAMKENRAKLEEGGEP